jgi:prepilin-type N-terminal cleavage/methylation domain-containing protein
MNKKRNKGFTLIELLVVIAIIALLSTTVMASLSSARMKSKDAAIKAQASQLATMMELNFSDYGSYCQLQYGWITAIGTCNTIFSGTHANNAREACKKIYNISKDHPTSPGYRIYSNTTTGCAKTFSFMTRLNNGNWYCIGSSGSKGEYGYYGDPPNSNPGCYGNP